MRCAHDGRGTASAGPTRRDRHPDTIDVMTRTDSVTVHRIRVSDADREVVADRLRAAAAEGRLTLDEADERQALAYAARTAEDLEGLTTDLPAPPPEPEPRHELTSDARRRLGIHAAVVAVIAALVLARWVVGVVAFGATPFFWPMWPLFWLGVTLVVHHRRARRRAVVAAR